MEWSYKGEFWKGYRNTVVCLAEELAEMGASPSKVQEAGMKLDPRLDGGCHARSIKGTLANIYWETYHKRRSEVYDMSTM
tara:strand:+ start:143 stop:382 length:240 start_codon:yes stop_codon:yes gene_type:complete